MLLVCQENFHKKILIKVLKVLKLTLQMEKEGELRMGFKTEIEELALCPLVSAKCSLLTGATDRQPREVSLLIEHSNLTNQNTFP